MSTLVERILQEMRDDIYRGNLHAGEQLKQVELARRYGVSPIPMREALLRLRAEGLVEHYAYRGTVITPLTKAEALDIVDIRNALEAQAFRIAWPSLDEAQIEQLAKITAEMDSDRSHDAPFVTERLNRYYEVLLAKEARPLLLNLIQTNLKRAARYYAELSRLAGGRPRELPTRKMYLDPMRRRDFDALMGAMQDLHGAYARHFQRLLVN